MSNIILHGIDDRLDKLLEDTHYQLIYQEQVMIICMQLAGYSLGEADKIRKTIGRKIQSELDKEIPKLKQGFLNNGMKEESANTLCQAIQVCGSYSFNKCLAGTERIMRMNNEYPYTIEEMYKITNDRAKYHSHNFGKSYSMTEDGSYIPNKIINIEFSGTREVYKVTLENGLSVRCTDNHKFPTPNGNTMLCQLKIGDSLYVIEKDKQLNYGYMVGDGTNLPKKGQCGFQKKDISVSKIFEEYRTKCKSEKRKCEICGKEYDGSRFELHHIDLNRMNSDLENLQWLCCSCHKKEHYKIGRRKAGLARRYFKLYKIVSIEYDGIENTYSVEMADNPHNFTLANGIVSCNSHAVEYGLITYQTAYLKANYPLQYMCSLLNGNIDSEDDVIKYINECKRMGIKILPPSVKAGNMRFAIENNSIRVGLAYLKGINNLEFQYYNSITEFLSQNKFNKRVKEALIKSGAMDCFNIPRNKLFAIAFDIQSEIDKEQNKILSNELKIKDKYAEIKVSKQGTKKVATLKKQIENLYKAIKKYRASIAELQNTFSDDYDEIQGEIEILGFTFKDKYAEYDTDYSVYNPDNMTNQIIIGEVVEFKKHIDKNGNQMAFVKIIPYNSYQYDFVMFARDYKELSNGIYVFKINRGNIIIDVAQAKKNKAN